MRRLGLLLILTFTVTGCNRQDVDGLGRIGRKVADHTRAAVSPLREKFDHTLKGMGGASGLKERVQQRIQWDKALADTNLEVIVIDAEIELRGKLTTEVQRRRAVELVESTVGVERVTDRLQVE